MGGAAGAIGGIASGIGSIMGAQSQSSANEQANDIRQQQLAYQQALSDRLLDAQLGTFIDPRGNVVSYDEDTRTWSTDTSPQTQRLIDASDAEQLARLTTDSAMRRGGLESNMLRRSDEGRAADSVLRQMQQPAPVDRETLAALLADQAMRGIADAYDTTSSQMNMQALRSGEDAGGNIAARMAQQRGQDTSRALQDALINSFGMSEDLENSRMGRLSNNYNMLASRASNIDNTPFQPTNLGENLGNMQANRAQSSIGAGQIASYGPANAANTLAQGIAANPSTQGGMLAAAGGMLPYINDLFGNTSTSSTDNRHRQNVNF